MATKRARATPRLLVVFDTNALFTGSESNLVRKEVGELIVEHSGHPDLSIEWHLPAVVIQERGYQMLSRALDLVPSIARLERLLGHNLNITSEIVQQRVNDAIQREIDQFSLRRLELDVEKVAWTQLIHDAAYRIPPFEAGEKEKGFRDAIIMQSFLQLAEDSPKTPKQCRLVLVTGDDRLSTAVAERVRDAKNCKVIGSVEELRGFINALVADVTEEFVAQIADLAAAYFFKKNDETTLYYREGVKQQIRRMYATELAATPEPGMTRRGGTWWVGSPQFERKEGQRVFWTSRITVDAKIPATENPLLEGLLGGLPVSMGATKSPSSKGLLSFIGSSAGPAAECRFSEPFPTGFSK